MWSSVSDLLEPEIFWSPKGLSCSTSPDLTSTAHADCLGGSGSLGATLAFVLGSHPIPPGSLKHCTIPYNWAAPSPISISWAFFRNSVPEQAAKLQPLSITPSCLQDKYHLGNLYTQPSTIDTVLSHSRLQFLSEETLIVSLKKQFSENFSSIMLGSCQSSLIPQLWFTSMYYPSRANNFLQ